MLQQPGGRFQPTAALLAISIQSTLVADTVELLAPPHPSLKYDLKFMFEWTCRMEPADYWKVLLISSDQRAVDDS